MDAYSYPPAPEKSNLEILLEKFIVAQEKQNEEFRQQGKMVTEAIGELTSKIDSLAARSMILEAQISQQAISFAEAPSSHIESSDDEVNEELTMRDTAKEESKEYVTLEEPLETAVHNMGDEMNQSEDAVVTKEIHSTMLADDTSNSHLNKYVGLHACVDITRLTHSPCLPSFYVKQLILETGSLLQNMDISSMAAKVLKSTHEIRHPRLHKYSMHVDAMGDAIVIVFDPGGIKKGFIILLQEPCIKPWDPGISCCVAFVTWVTCYKIWDPGGSFIGQA